MVPTSITGGLFNDAKSGTCGVAAVGGLVAVAERVAGGGHVGCGSVSSGGVTSPGVQSSPIGTMGGFS